MNSPSAISRVGIVAKSHLHAAVPHLVDIAAWLRARHIEAIFESATAALMPSADGHRVAEKLALVEMVDMVSAQRAYEANVAVLASGRRMAQKALDILQA